MMEQISDFLKDLRERFASPFFFSFVIAWILWNWHVTVALIWYNADLYPFRGDLIQFIHTNTHWVTSILLPFLSAAIYVGVVRNLISAFVTASIKWGENLNLRISKESNVPMSKFLTYRDMYLKSHDELQKIIQDESKTIQNYEALRLNKSQVDAENVALKGEVESLKATNDQLELKRSAVADARGKLETDLKGKEEVFKNAQMLVHSYNNLSFMNGRWKFKYDNTFRDLHFEETFEINAGTINTVNQNRTQSSYRIKFFFHDVINHKMLLLLTFIEGTTEANYVAQADSNIQTFKVENDKQKRTYFRTKYAPVLIHELEVKDLKRLIGNENVEALISYEKLS